MEYRLVETESRGEFNLKDSKLRAEYINRPAIAYLATESNPRTLAKRTWEILEDGKVKIIVSLFEEAANNLWES